MENKKNISLYYNNRIEKAINDYFIHNKRLVEALTFSIQNIPGTVKNILDLGCGIGWTSHEYAKHFQDSQVLGFDISDQCIEFAKSFFRHPNLNFQTGDIGQLSDYVQDKFEIITLIDVFEHIEKSERHHFYDLIRKNIADNGKVLLTFPSIYHQNFLREHNPEELQPVDENIVLDDLQQFSSSIGAEISYFMYKSVFRWDDYIHTILDKNLGKYGKSENRSDRVRVNLDKQFDKYIRITRYRGNIYSETINRNKKYWWGRYIKNYFKKRIN